jgi:hypothetical protein
MGKGRPVLMFWQGDTMDIENQLQVGSGGNNSKYRGFNLFGSFLILLIAVTLTTWIIWPDLETSLNIAMQTRGIMDWLYVSEGLLLAGFVIAFPFYLVVQATMHYRQSK